MADSPPPASSNPLLRGLFGSLQSAASQSLDTSSIWSSLRAAAGSWQFSARGVAQPWDPTELEAAGRAILSAQGVNGATVSTFRGIAGSWLGSKQRLHALGEQEQITGRAVFTAPWARTADASVPSRYRLRTQWQVTPSTGDPFTVWKADEIDGPLTTLADMLGQAQPTAKTTSGQAILSGDTPPLLADFELEQI